MSVNRRRGHGYRSAAEIRRVRMGNLLFALIATVAVCIQISLISGYFSARAEKKDKAELYNLSQSNLEKSQEKVDAAKADYDALIADIANLESKLAGLEE